MLGRLEAQGDKGKKGGPLSSSRLGCMEFKRIGLSMRNVKVRK